MPAWLNKVINSLPAIPKISGIPLPGISEIRGLVDGRESVRRALRDAQRDRVKIELQVPSSSRKFAIITNIEQVRKDDLAVSQPMIEGESFPLAFGEHFILSFPSPDGYHTGATRCLGRMKVTVDAQEGVDQEFLPTISAYRLALPESLFVDERRGFPRVRLNLGKLVPMQLYSYDSGEEPVVGELFDISMSGARIHARIAPGDVTAGEALFLKGKLPPPVGEIDELVDITRVDLEARGEPYTIGITFRRRIVGLDEVIRVAQGVQAQRDVKRKSA
ncbi:MAG: PilZ domain-containing protein [Phycisphaerales bacterium]|nr:PilZ domain-containing protein [Phycisphaerales bacterium]MCI0629360.1 PilZ domain-containing protein [Phycisphaerales bacterium]MCI0674552.1 PilZ domain-containing protein [Phycisphaerales bacterium]